MKKKKVISFDISENELSAVPNTIKDSIAPYGSIRPSSYELQEEENRIYSAGLSPNERLALLKLLIINAYGKEVLEIKSFGTKINH